MDKKIIVAIDGYSSCGKSTMAKQLAREIGYIYVDTGAMYRGITLVALRKGFISANGLDVEALEGILPEIDLGFRLNADNIPELYLGDECIEQEIRTMQVAEQVSRVASLPAVRAYLTKEQRRMGQERGVVMDGRDIGTAVFPDAELKVFVTAEPRIRAERRLLELRSKGDMQTSLDEVLRNVEERDYMDTHRQESPLRQADDAIVLDNSYLSREEQSDRLLQLYCEALNKA